MKHIMQIRDMLCDELDDIAKKGQLTADSLDAVDMLTHSIKSIDTILAMEESGYSNEYSGRYSGRSYEDGYSRRGSYARGRRGNVRRDSMGRYSNEMDE